MHEGFGGKKTIRRSQLPLTPCQSMTVPMVQGKTLGRFLLDLNVDDAPGHKMTCLYVMISRATRINNIRLLQPFHHAQLHRCRDTAIRNEELRLLQIESSTLQQFIKAHPECATDVFAIHQPPKEQQTQTKKRSTLSEDSDSTRSSKRLRHTLSTVPADSNATRIYAVRRLLRCLARRVCIS